MATTEILAPGTTAASSAEQNVPSGEMATLAFKPAAGKPLGANARANVESKSSSGDWIHVGVLSNNQGSFMPAADLLGPKTFRVSRPTLDASDACGVDLT